MQNHEYIEKLSSIHKEQFDALFRISQLLNSSDLQENLISDALDLVVRVLNAERALFAKCESEPDKFSIIAARNLEQEDISDLSEFSSGILKKVINAGLPCLYHDVQSDPNISQFESVQIHKIKSVIGVPIILEGTIWGVILADSQANRKNFTEENLEFLNFFSNLVSLALNKIIKIESLQDENLILKKKIEASEDIPDMVGASNEMRKIANLIHRVAGTDATVLLLGESGTGKDLAARAIHMLSKRKDRSFIAQFCGSIPDTLLESELFGYKKGAFSGANTDKKGMFEVASGGTFFLDEIGDISLSTQAKLLRVIQNQEIIRLGDTQVKKVDVRIITATNQDLKQLVAKGKFRQDLYYRLNVFPITLPPLRERRADIALLIRHLISKHRKKEIQLPAISLQKLENYHWPGNIRQLENILQRALILCDGDRLLPEHIIFEDEEKTSDFSGQLKDLEKQILLKRLKEFDNNRTLTARSLGVSVRWVQMKLKEIEEKS
ncbi:sigma 54-interacting transcriptional regulator [candidate division KSB1 bacterium]|nr:sigma 54-interacting transcriptional regulator [candidate division KSB1 bacterium]